MLIFGIDTCCMAATAALMDEDRLLAQTVVNHKKTHSQKMMPQIEAMFRFAECTPHDADCFAAAVGPGSFTGVRIGVATAKALAQACQKPCAAVSTLHALAFSSSVFDGILCPILDARRDQVYNGLFRGGKTFERIEADRALALRDLLLELSGQNLPVLFCGDGVLVYKDEIVKRLGDQACFASRMQNMNLGAAVAEIGLSLFLQGETVAYGDLTPQYIRLSQAERERLSRKEN